MLIEEILSLIFITPLVILAIGMFVLLILIIYGLIYCGVKEIQKMRVEEKQSKQDKRENG